jgi:threonine/homoserine/homoserine lactone efflux protein
VLQALLTFLPVAALLTIVPGPATAMVVRSSLAGGRGAALRTTAGNSVGILAWALAAALGVGAIVAASAAAFTTMKLICGAVLIVLGLQAIVRSRRHAHAATPARPRERRPGRPFRDGLATSVSNPKLAVFFVALFPQFVPDGAPVLPYALAMTAVIVMTDLMYYSALAYAVTRARRAFTSGPWGARLERPTGGVMVGLGLRVALERRA